MQLSVYDITSLLKDNPEIKASTEGIYLCVPDNPKEKDEHKEIDKILSYLHKFNHQHESYNKRTGVTCFRDEKGVKHIVVLKNLLDDYTKTFQRKNINKIDKVPDPLAQEIKLGTKIIPAVNLILENTPIKKTNRIKASSTQHESSQKDSIIQEDQSSKNIQSVDLNRKYDITNLSKTIAKKYDLDDLIDKDQIILIKVKDKETAHALLNLHLRRLKKIGDDGNHISKCVMNNQYYVIYLESTMKKYHLAVPISLNATQNSKIIDGNIHQLDSKSESELMNEICHVDNLNSRSSVFNGIKKKLGGDESSELTSDQENLGVKRKIPETQIEENPKISKTPKLTEGTVTTPSSDTPNLSTLPSDIEMFSEQYQIDLLLSLQNSSNVESKTKKNAFEDCRKYDITNLCKQIAKDDSLINTIENDKIFLISCPTKEIANSLFDIYRKRLKKLNQQTGHASLCEMNGKYYLIFLASPMVSYNSSITNMNKMITPNTKILDDKIIHEPTPEQELEFKAEMFSPSNNKSNSSVYNGIKIQLSGGRSIQSRQKRMKLNPQQNVSSTQITTPQVELSKEIREREIVNPVFGFFAAEKPQQVEKSSDQQTPTSTQTNPSNK